MKNKIKILLLFIIIFMASGCSGNYNLKINNDLSIEENLELTLNNSDAYEKSLKIFEDNDVSKDNYNVVVNGSEVKITYKEKFDSIEKYIDQSKVYPQLFSDLEFNRKGEYVDLYASGNLKLKNSYTINGGNLNDLDVLQINVTNPFNVLITNAELVNDNTYTWTIKKSDISKKIQMQFKPTLNKFPIRPIIVIISILIVSFILLFNLYRKFKNTQKF